MTTNYRSEAAKQAARTRKVNAAEAKAEEALRALNDLSPKAARSVMSALLSAQMARQESAAVEYAAKDESASDNWQRAFWNLRSDVAGWLEQVDRVVANTKFRVEQSRKRA